MAFDMQRSLVPALSPVSHFALTSTPNEKNS
jgi:hypothetical protein